MKTFGDLLMEMENWRYSKENFQLMKECMEIDLEEKYLESQQFMMENSDIVGYMESGYFMEAADDKTKEEQGKDVAKKKKNIFVRIWDFIWKILCAIGRFFKMLWEKLFGRGKKEETETALAAMNASMAATSPAPSSAAPASSTSPAPASSAPSVPEGNEKAAFAKEWIRRIQKVINSALKASGIGKEVDFTIDQPGEDKSGVKQAMNYATTAGVSDSDKRVLKSRLKAALNTQISVDISSIKNHYLLSNKSDVNGFISSMESMVKKQWYGLGKIQNKLTSSLHAMNRERVVITITDESFKEIESGIDTCTKLADRIRHINSIEENNSSIVDKQNSTAGGWKEIIDIINDTVANTMKVFTAVTTYRTKFSQEYSKEFNINYRTYDTGSTPGSKTNRNSKKNIEADDKETEGISGGSRSSSLHGANAGQKRIDKKTRMKDLFDN